METLDGFLGEFIARFRHIPNHHMRCTIVRWTDGQMANLLTTNDQRLTTNDYLHRFHQLILRGHADDIGPCR